LAVAKEVERDLLDIQGAARLWRRAPPGGGEGGAPLRAVGPRPYRFAYTSVFERKA